MKNLMPHYKVVLLAPAKKELEEIAEYHLLVVGVNSARRIVENILAALERLEEFPLSCPLAPDEELKSQNYRILVCDQYICFYRLLGETVFVYHIASWAIEYSKLFR
ncbi:type II toxin-antitoxin system RelE/ParE family toxin [Acetobacterium sp.]|uniref:type II toxin-antitoxin system RelE/ParE family toxin n=1 Tax=Acetobacterium sp. TaxID=1872094 RepID=UPI00359350C1